MVQLWCLMSAIHQPHKSTGPFYRSWEKSGRFVCQGKRGKGVARCSCGAHECHSFGPQETPDRSEVSGCFFHSPGKTPRGPRGAVLVPHEDHPRCWGHQLSAPSASRSRASFSSPTTIRSIVDMNPPQAKNSGAGDSAADHCSSDAAVAAAAARLDKAERQRVWNRRWYDQHRDAVLLKRRERYYAEKAARAAAGNAPAPRKSRTLTLIAF